MKLMVRTNKKGTQCWVPLCLHENVIAGGFDSNTNQRIDH